MNGVWHVLNFFGPALGVGLWAVVLTKLVWWRELAKVPWRSLGVWAVLPCLVVSVAGLWFWGRDGRMGMYAAMVVACAMGLWWRGFRKPLSPPSS